MPNNHVIPANQRTALAQTHSVSRSVMQFNDANNRLWAYNSNGSDRFNVTGPFLPTHIMSEVTQILNAIELGDLTAADQLLPLVYDELRRLAAQKMAQEKPGQTLEATALVHEAYVRLVDIDQARQWNSRGHFFAAAAESMRRILIEHARHKARVRHGGKWQRVELHDIPQRHTPEPETIVAVGDAVAQLEEIDVVAANIVKLHFFAGMTLEETAHALNRSRATVYRQWAYARAWLRLTLRIDETESSE